MDSLTHVVIGAIVGDAFAGKVLGRRAMVIGAAVQCLPDLDVVASLWLSTPGSLLAHRGIMHSFLFLVLTTAILAAVAQRVSRVLTSKQWIIFFGTQIAIHLFLDAFNAYGVGWFEPFSPARISFNALFVADPFFLLVPSVSFIVLLMVRNERTRKRLIAAGIAAALLYPAYALVNKSFADTAARRSFAAANLPVRHYITTPTPFNTWLWYIVAESDSGYWIGYYSVFDKTDSVSLHFTPQREPLLREIGQSEEVDQLIRFARGYFTFESRGDTLVFNDLRFGQVTGWANPTAPFVFHYYLGRPGSNRAVLQRGRLAEWSEKNRDLLFRRILGNTDFRDQSR